MIRHFRDLIAQQTPPNEISPWNAIDSQAELDELNRTVCWEDSRVLGYLGVRHHDRITRVT